MYNTSIFNMKRDEIKNTQNILIHKAEIFCKNSQKVIATTLLNGGILIIIQKIDKPDCINTIYVSKNDPQYKHFSIFDQ